MRPDGGQAATRRQASRSATGATGNRVLEMAPGRALEEIVGFVDHRMPRGIGEVVADRAGAVRATTRESERIVAVFRREILGDPGGLLMAEEIGGAGEGIFHGAAPIFAASRRPSR